MAGAGQEGGRARRAPRAAGQGQPPRRACAGLSCPLAGKASGAAPPCPPRPPPPPRASAARATLAQELRVPELGQPRHPPPPSGRTGQGAGGRALLVPWLWWAVVRRAVDGLAGECSEEHTVAQDASTITQPAAGRGTQRHGPSK